MNAQQKLGIIACGGALPAELIRYCKEHDQDHFIIAFKGVTSPDILEDSDHAWLMPAKVGKIIKALKQENVDRITMVGHITRPPWSSLRPDLTALKLIKTLLSQPSQGDDTLLSIIIEFLEEQGFTVVGADEVMEDVVMQPGVQGKHKPNSRSEQDIALGVHTAKALGAMDIGQAVITQEGRVIGVEAVEGTDGLIARCKPLLEGGEGGVLIKMKKPTQDRRVDLPTIGLDTVIHASESGLQGIAVEAGSALMLQREELLEKADALGIFVLGIDASDEQYD